MTIPGKFQELPCRRSRLKAHGLRSSQQATPNMVGLSAHVGFMLPHGGDAVYGVFPSASLVLFSPRPAIVSQAIAVMIRSVAYFA